MVFEAQHGPEALADLDDTGMAVFQSHTKSAMPKSVPAPGKLGAAYSPHSGVEVQRSTHAYRIVAKAMRKQFALQERRSKP